MRNYVKLLELQIYGKFNIEISRKGYLYYLIYEGKLEELKTFKKFIEFPINRPEKIPASNMSGEFEIVLENVFEGQIKRNKLVYEIRRIEKKEARNELYNRIVFSVNCRDINYDKRLYDLNVIVSGANFNVHKIKNNNLHVEIDLDGSQSYRDCFSKIKAITSFYSLYLGAQCFEYDVVFCKGDEMYPSYGDSTNNVSTPHVVFNKLRFKNLDNNRQCQILKIWLEKYYERHRVTILFLQYLHRNDFNNPHMYLKETISYFEGFAKEFNPEKINEIDKNDAKTIERFKKELNKCLSLKELFPDNYVKINDNIKLIVSDKFVEKMKYLFCEMDVLILEEDFYKKLSTFRNTNVHDPQNSPYILERELIGMIYLIREAMIYLIFKEIFCELKIYDLKLINIEEQYNRITTYLEGFVCLRVND